MATQMLNADTGLVTIQTLLGHSNITTNERYSKIYNAKVKRDYFKAMSIITNKTNDYSSCTSDYSKFFTKDKRFEVLNNFGVVNPDP